MKRRMPPKSSAVRAAEHDRLAATERYWRKPTLPYWARPVDKQSALITRNRKRKK